MNTPSAPAGEAPAFDWRNGTLTAALAHAVAWRADGEAMVHGELRWTYAQWSARVAAAADGLAGLGIGPGDLVGVLHANHPHMQVLQFAVARRGAVFVPFNVALSTADLRQLIAHSGVALVIVGGSYRGAALAQSLRAALPECPATAIDVAMESHPQLRRVLDLGDSLAPLERCATQAGTPAVACAPDDVSHIVYTSGSTRFPKGARLRHRGLLGGAHHWRIALGLGATDRMLVTLPFFHTGGLVLSALSTLLAGGCIHTAEQVDEHAAVRTIAREGITAMGTLDYQLRRIVALAREEGRDLSSWTKSWSQAASYPLRKQLGVRRIVGFYAMTEASNPAALVMPDETREAIRSTANGRALPGVELRIVDPDTETVCAPGVRGEIRFRGWNRFAGYHNPAPEDTPDKVFDAEGYFRTGDCGHLDADGYLYLTGRYKDMIKSGGENVSALEVEDWLVNHIDAIRTAQVVGIADARWGEAVVAFVEAKPDCQPEAAAIIAACKAALSPWKVPKHVLFMASHEWPLSSTEMVKVRKDDLRRRALALLHPDPPTRSDTQSKTEETA